MIQIKPFTEIEYWSKEFDRQILKEEKPKIRVSSIKKEGNIHKFCVKFCVKKHFNPEDQFQTTVLDEKWIKIFLRFSSSIWCNLRPTQYGSGVKNEI